MRGNDIPRYVQPPDATYAADHPTHYMEPEPYSQEYKLPDDSVHETLVDLLSPEPVAVTVVAMPRDANTVTSFLATQHTIEPGKRVALSRADHRQRLRVANTDAAKTVYIMHNDGAINAQNGYPLAPGKDLDIGGTREVYIANPDAVASVIIGVYAESVNELT